MSETSYYVKIYTEEYCDVAAFALIFYEYIITIDREASCIWGSRFTAATAIFLLNRYVALLKYPLAMVGLTPLSDERCHIVNILAMCLETLPYFIWLLFSTTRVYAVCDRRWRYALPVLLTASMPVASNIYLYTQTGSENYPLPIGYHRLGSLLDSLTDWRSLLIATRTSVITADVLVLGITWWRTYGISRAVAAANMQVSLATLLLRDGTIYFLILLTLNVFHMAFTLTNTFTYTITFEEPLTTILISRFFLNLREVDLQGRTHSLDTSQPSFVAWPGPTTYNDGRTYSVADFIASMGAPLDHGDFVQESGNHDTRYLNDEY